MARFFVTGTSTEIGKTFVSATLLRTWRALGTPVVGLKPIACGDRDDPHLLESAANSGISLDEINPVYLPEPLAPLLAAERAGVPIDPPRMVEKISATADKFQVALIEGAGGWRVPITSTYFMSDLARDLETEIILVASASLGTINHTLLTLEAIARDRLTVKGLIVNHHTSESTIASQTNADLLSRLCNLPVLELPHHGTLATLPDWLPLPPRKGVIS